MSFQTVFQRYELKYLLTPEQKAAVRQAMAPYMELDRYGRTTIRNIYFDTDNYRLVRRSIEKPVYKEKLRVRSYRQAGPETPVFVELKKKYKHVVYKRRIALPEQEAMAWLQGGEKGVCGMNEPSPKQRQIFREVEYFLNYYETLTPAVFLSYEREAYCTREPSDFRVTFDERILCRREELSLEAGISGSELLPENMTLMEIKCAGGIPLWMTHVLTQEHIYKTSFSKYGTAYQRMIYPGIWRGFQAGAVPAGNEREAVCYG